MAHGLSLELAKITPPDPVVISEQPHANRQSRRHMVVGPTRRTVIIPRADRRPALNEPYRKPAESTSGGGR